ncbi:MAG: Gfo/Idh/MocA family oxidoreductase [Alphaproteobacteria bacterium]
MADRRLRTGVIGLGFIGGLHARIHHEAPNIDLVAVADLNEDLGRPMAEKMGVAYHRSADELLARADIEAVSVCVPDRMHVAPACAAARAGKHMLLEKPLAHTAAAAEEIVRAVDDAGVRMMVAHVLHFDPRYAQMREAAARGDFGEIINLRAKRNTMRALPQRLGASSSIMYYLGVHDIDMLQWCAGANITRVYAQQVRKLGNEIEDAVYAVVNFANGAIGSIDYCWSWPEGLPSGYTVGFDVVGKKSAAHLDVYDQGLQFIGADGVTQPDTHLWPEVNGQIVGALRDEIVHFADAILTGRPFVEPVERSLQAVRVLDALFASLNSGAPADVANA